MEFSYSEGNSSEKKIVISVMRIFNFVTLFNASQPNEYSNFFFFFFLWGIVSVVTLVNDKDLLSTVKSRKYYPKKISVTRIIKKAFPASEMLFIIL